jgi:alkyl sulfatase BDS1-like metallo-beta-lactamase superfamily hydrolase
MSPNWATLDAIARGEATFERERTSGAIRIEGEAQKPAELLGMLDTFETDFNIVTP